MKNIDKNQLKTIDDDFKNLVYTHKTHEKEAELQEKSNYWINLATVIFTALTSTSLLGDIFTVCNLEFLTAILSFFALFFALYQFAFRHSDMALSHRYTAKQLLALRNQYKHFLVDIQSGELAKDIIVSRRDELSRKAELIYGFAPQTSPEAYKLAEKELDKIYYPTQEV